MESASDLLCDLRPPFSLDFSFVLCKMGMSGLGLITNDEVWVPWRQGPPVDLVG